MYARGTHLKAGRLGGLYTHHGIYVGNGQVVHFSGQLGRKSDARIRRDTLEAFADGVPVQVVAYGATRHDLEQAARRAERRVGERGYGLMLNNCEHFARECRTGKHHSEQVQDLAAGVVGTAGGGAATSASLGVVSAAGTAAGLSGPGIMSGLASAGGAVGGGAVAGVALLGAVPGAIGAGAMLYALRDDASLPSSERNARGVGRAASVGGALAGSAASVAAIGSAGTVAGVGGAGITSGLAAIGGTVGGGMAAGTAMTVAAPAVAAAALGYGLYRFAKWLAE